VATSKEGCRGLRGAPIWISSFDEGQQIWVDGFGVGREHAMRKTGIELQGRVLEELDLQLGGALVRNDLIVAPCMHKVGASMLLRSSVKSVSENALMLSY
jgi:hypothetical protein